METETEGGGGDGEDVGDDGAEGFVGLTCGSLGTLTCGSLGGLTCGTGVGFDGDGDCAGFGPDVDEGPLPDSFSG